MYIVVDGAPKLICRATDWIMSETYDVLEKTGPQGKGRDYLSTYTGYTLQVPGVVAYTENVNILQLRQWAREGKRLNWLGTPNAPGEGVVESGVMLITNITVTAQFRDCIRFDMSAIGCGLPDTQTLPFVRPVYLAGFDGVRLVGCPNPYPVMLYWYDGTLIGPANNADDVISQFNSYPNNSYYTLTGYTTGCDFTLSAAWDAPEIPTTVIAEPAPEMALWTGSGDGGIANDQDNNELISPYYNA